MNMRPYGAAVAALLISAATAQAEIYTVMQSGKKFDQKSITVKVGDEITFVNRDRVAHNVYSRTKGNQFDLKVQKPGASNTVAFDRVGTVRVRCAVHPKMKLSVSVIN